MPKFKVKLSRLEYLIEHIVVDAKDAEEAQDIAWDESGKWECVNAEESTESVEELQNA
jgi:hypothetical protein